MYKLLNTEYPVLSNPLTRAETIRAMDDTGCVEKVISVNLSDLIHAGYENFLDLIAEKVIGNVCLSDIQYSIAGCGEWDEVLLLVSGHADHVADALDGVPYDLDTIVPGKFTFKSRQNSLAGGILYHAEKSNEHGDYHIKWDGSATEKDRSVGNEAKGDDYTMMEVKYFISSSQWEITASE